MALRPYDGDFEPIPESQQPEPKNLKPYDGDFTPLGEEDKPRQNKSLLDDLGTDLKRGIQQLPGMGTGLLDIPVAAVTGQRMVSKGYDELGKITGFQPSKWAEEAKQEYSPQRRAAEAEIDQVWDDGSPAEIAGAYMANPGYVAGKVVESLPQMAAGGVIGRGAIAGARSLGMLANPATAAQAARQAALGAGVGEGAVIAGGTMDQIDESVDPRRAAAAATGAGVVGGALGGLGARAAQHMGLLDAESAFAGGLNRATGEPPGLGRRMAGGALAEGALEELPQSVQEQMWQNWAEEKPLTEGAARAAVEGTLAGSAIGAGVNIIPGRKPSEQQANPAATPEVPDTTPAADLVQPTPTPENPAPAPVPRPDPNAGPLSRAASQLPASAPLDAAVADPQPAPQAQPEPPPEQAGAQPAETGMAADDLTPYERNQLRANGVTDEQLWQMTTEQARAAMPAAGQQGEQQAVQPGGNTDQQPAPEVSPQAQQAPSVQNAEVELSPREQRALATTFRKRGAAEIARRNLPNPDRFAVEQQGSSWSIRQLPTATDQVHPDTAPEAAQTEAYSAVGSLPDQTAEADQSSINQEASSKPAAVDDADLVGQEKQLSPEPPTPDQPEPQPLAQAADLAAASSIDAAAHEAATSPQNDRPEPTQAQKEAGVYKKGHVRVQGLDITVENPRGSERSGKRPDGSEWRHTMSDHYGYIKRTKGADGEQVDAYIGPNPDGEQVFVVDQLDQQSGGFDEHKVMLGFNDEAAAIAAYRSNFDADWKVGPVRAMPMAEFKAWLKEGDTAKPAAEQQPAKAESTPAAAQPTPPANWRGNYIQAQRYAKSLGMPIDKGKKLADVVAAIEEHLGGQRKAEPAAETPVAAGAAEQSQSEAVRPKLPVSENSKADPEAFVVAPDGSPDFGEITPEMAQAAGRQAARIRLQHGDAKFGLMHIEARHGDQIRRIGYDSVEQFVRSALESPDFLWKPSTTTQLVVIEQDGKGKAVFVQLQLQLQPARDEAGDFYTVNTAYPISSGYAEKKKGWKVLWSREAVPAAAPGERAPFAEPDHEAGDQATMPSGQSSETTVAQSATKPPSNWRLNYIQARQSAKALGVPVEKGQKLDEVVAQIEAQIEQQPIDGQQAEQGLPDILTMPRRRYIEHQAKAAGLKKGSPGYDQAIQRLQGQYEAEADRASAGLTFERYNALNSESPASANRQAWEALREEYGVAASDVPLFSRAPGTTGMSVEEVEAAYQQLTQGMENVPLAKVVQSTAELPFDAPEDVLGAYWRGTIYLVADNIASAQDAREVVAHEMIGHYGMAGFFGRELRPTLERIHENNPRVRMLASKWRRDNQALIEQWKAEYGMTDAQVKARSIEEALAGMAEKGERLKGWNRLAAMLQTLLRRMGATRWSDALEARTDAEALLALKQAEMFVRRGMKKADPRPDIAYPLFVRAREGGLASSQTLEEAKQEPQRYRADGGEGGLPLAEVKRAIVASPELAGVKVVQSFDDLPIIARFQALRDGVRPEQLRGVYSGGATYVVANNHGSVADAVYTAVHEEVGHRGIRGMLGSEIEPVMQRLYASQATTVKGRQRIKQIRRAYASVLKRLSIREKRLMIAEEMVAHLLEDGDQPTALQRVLSKMRELLRKMFPQVPWTYTDILALGEQSRAWLRRQQGDGRSDGQAAGRATDKPTHAAASRTRDGMGAEAGERVAAGNDGKDGNLYSRRGWDQDFPDVVLAHPLSFLSNHPDYAAAKAGDDVAALRVARDAVTPEFVEQVRAVIPAGGQPVIVPVLAREQAGDNRIPLAAAKVLAKHLGLRVDIRPIQAEKVGRTQSNALERIVNQPTFAGQVDAGDYLLLDDTLTQGGTLAQLKTHIEDGGGRVLAAIALTGKNYSRKLSLDPITLAEIRGKYGDIEPWWRETFGYGFEGLTQSEARTLLTFDKGRLSPDEIRDRLTAAKFRGLGPVDGRATGDRSGTEAPVNPDDTRYSLADEARAVFERAIGPTPLDPTDPFAVENRRLREEDRTLWDKAKKMFARQFAPGGLLPKSVFAEKITRDSEFQAVEFDVRHLAGALNNAAKRDFGTDLDGLDAAQVERLAESLAGQLDPTLPEGTKAAVVAMRQYIDRLSADYLTIIQGQIDELQAKAGTSEQAARAAKDAQRAFKDALDASTDPALVQARTAQKVALRERKQLKKAMKGLKGEAKKAARQAYDEAVQAHERSKTATRQAMTPELRRLERLAGEAAAAADAARGAQYDAEAEAALYEKIKANIGAYVHRSYQAFDDPKWFKSVPTETLNAARQYLIDGYLAMGETGAEARRMAEVTMAEILKTGTAYDSMEAMISEGKLGAKDLSVLIKRKEIAPEIRALLGEYRDPRINFAKSATKMGRLIWNQRFLDRVREIGLGSFLFIESERPADATVQIAGEQSEVYAPLNGLWTFPEVAQAFKDALGKEQMSDLYRTIVRWNGFVKYGKTVLSPTTAMRNWQSAMFFSLANGHFDLSQMKKGMMAFREQVTQNATGSDLAYLRKLKQLGVVYDTPYAGEMAALMADARMDELLSSPSGTGLKWLRKANQFAQGFYSFGDDFWKIVGFENEKAGLLAAGMDEEKAEKEAAQRIRSTYPTYSMIGRGINWLRRFPLAGTFVSFPAEIIRTSANMLRITAADLKSGNPQMVALGRKRAAGMAFVSAAFYALSVLTAAAFGVDDDEEEALRDLSPDWSKNSTFLFLGRDADGKLRSVDLSFLDPYGYWKRPITAMLRDQPWEEAAASGLADMLSPFFGADIAAGAIFQVLANRKTTGGQVYNENADSVDQLQDIANHMRKALQPGFVSNAERLRLAGSGAHREGSGQPYDMRDEVVTLLGWRAGTLDAKTGLYYRAFDFTGGLKQAKQTLTRELRSVNSVSDGDIREASDAAQRQHSKAFAEMARLVHAAEVSGLSRQEIAQTLRRSKVAPANIFALMQGRVPPMQVGLQAQQDAVQQARAMQGAEHAAEVARRFRVAREVQVAQ